VDCAIYTFPKEEGKEKGGRRGRKGKEKGERKKRKEKGKGKDKGERRKEKRSYGLSLLGVMVSRPFLKMVSSFSR
jgi:hypothetical protein